MVERSENASPSCECCIHPVGTQETSIRFYVMWLDYSYIVYCLDVEGVVSLLYFGTK